MNRTARVLMGLVAFGFLLAPVATAQTNQGQLKPDNEGIFTHITMDCFHVKLKLSKVHERDGVMRVTLGQAYDSLSSKLITKLNTKIASQNLDGGKLLAHAAAFQKEHAAFIDSYKTYEFAMNHLLKSDCRTQRRCRVCARRFTSGSVSYSALPMIITSRSRPLKPRCRGS